MKRKTHAAEENPKSNETPHKKLKIDKRQTDEDDLFAESGDEVDVTCEETDQDEVSVKKVFTETSTQFGSEERISLQNAESENLGLLSLLHVDTSL